VRKREGDVSRSDARPLSDEEIELWRAVAKSVAARKGARLPAPRKRLPPAAAHFEKPLAAQLPKPRPTPASQPLAPLEKRLKRQLVRGGVGPDDVIDLHGMTEGEAHRALRGFLVYAQAQGARLVLVITGKGQRQPERPLWSDEPGVLRRLTPHWLRAGELRAIVLGFEEAGRSHGGAGALYVRLRRPGAGRQGGAD
jgi:DNA-nicking Smr family endonuclease